MFEPKDYSIRKNIMNLRVKDLAVNAHLVMECIAECKRRNPDHTTSKSTFYEDEPKKPAYYEFSPNYRRVEECWVFTHNMIIELLNPSMKNCNCYSPYFQDVALTLLYLHKRDFISCVGNTRHNIYVENPVELDDVFILPTQYKRTKKGLKWYMGLKHKEKLKKQLETITKKQGE
jgi:hypothetical protein